jgi:hypothetical protein
MVSISAADVGEELIAEALALARAGDEPGDVDELDHRRHDALGRDDLDQRIEPGIGHRDDPVVGLNRTKRIVRRLCAGVGQRVEQRGFADVGETDDADSEAHGGREVARRRELGQTLTPARRASG